MHDSNRTRQAAGIRTFRRPNHWQVIEESGVFGSKEARYDEIGRDASCSLTTKHYFQKEFTLDPLNLRIGIGHDTHRLIEGGKLILGGVEVPHTHSLAGHSDADVLLHAVTDAVLGAAAMGDIGELFPNTDAVNQGRDSAEMLKLAVQQVNENGFQIINLDCIVFAQRPKLASFKSVIAESIASIVGISSQRVGVKAKTGESVGPVGKELSMEAQCVALLYQP